MKLKKKRQEENKTIREHWKQVERKTGKDDQKTTGIVFLDKLQSFLLTRHNIYMDEKNSFRLTQPNMPANR